MLDRIGSLEIAARQGQRVQLSLSRSTQFVGWVVLVIGLYLAYSVGRTNLVFCVGPLAFAMVGAVLLSWRREFDFDRCAGVLRYQQRVFGIGQLTVIPLFHLRAIVVSVRTKSKPGKFLRNVAVGDYVAYIERRVGDPIYLDESRRCAHLLRMAEIVAEVADLRLEYDAMSQAESG